MSSRFSHRLKLQSQWISLSKAAIFFITISSSMIQGQITDPSDIDDFIPSFGPHGTRVPSYYNNDHNKGTRIITRQAGGGGSAAFGSGDLQTNFFDLFDWNKEMPVQDIVNTFLDNEDDLPILKEMEDSCSKRDFFYGTNPSHMSVVTKIKNLIMEQTNAHDALMMAGSLRDKPEVNPNAWLRGVIAASMFRDDLKGLRKPAMLEVMPSMMLNTVALRNMKVQSEYGEQSRSCVTLDGSAGRDNGIENVLWYWREDVMLNSHHWYWHLTYPIESDDPRGDRRGELFYFMHHTFLARYHAERLAHDLPPVLPLNLQRGTLLREPYNAHLTDTNSGMDWTPRPADVPIQDTMSTAIPDSAFFTSVDNRTLYQSRILDGIADRALLSENGGTISLRDYTGIDFLGDVIEASEFSINPDFYGARGIHNTGHVLISLSVDPVQERQLPPGVMGEPGTAMRDVIFYPYHTFIDDIFDAHKRTLPPYQLTGGEWPLVWPGVEITNVKVQSYDLPINQLQTFWSEKRYDLSRGLDFNRTRVQGSIWTCVRHLDHQDFEYRFTVLRKNFVRSSKATFRIYLAPRYDSKGRKYVLEEQRRRFFILDKFTAKLTPGKNTIVRKSDLTPLTVDFPQSLRELNSDSTIQQTPYCGCGWPHHLLLPKGTPQGMVFDLFVMVTNHKEDFVPQSNRPQVCRAAPIFCGINGELYPDARPMGYPFDRPIYKTNHINPLDPAFDEVEGPITIDEWVTEIPNAAFTKITITHTNEFRGIHGGGDGSHILGGNLENPFNQFDGHHGSLDGPDPTPFKNDFGPSILTSPHPTPFKNDFGPSAAPGLKSLLEPTDFFNEFFPSTRPAKNHPKRFSSSIEAPSKEFLKFIG